MLGQYITDKLNRELLIFPSIKVILIFLRNEYEKTLAFGSLYLTGISIGLSTRVRDYASN